MNKRSWFVIAACGAWVTSCGASRMPPTSSNDASAKSGRSSVESQAPYASPPPAGEPAGVAQPTASPAAPAPPPAAAPAMPESAGAERAAPSAEDPRVRRARANTELAEARRQVEVAANQRDCATACRALDSMQRAAAQLCDLARSTDERRTCQSAQDQVGAARDRVANACGACPK